MNKIITFGLVLVLLFLSCSKKEDQTDGDILPLAVGNRWVLLDSSFWADTIVDTIAFEISGRTTLNIGGTDRTAYLWTEYDPTTGVRGDIHWFYALENDGLRALGIVWSSDTLLGEALHIKYPVAVGESWRKYSVIRNAGELSFGDSIDVVCLAIDTPFKTAAGEFDCAVYRTTQIIASPQRDSGPDSTIEFDSYYAPGIGVVGFINRLGGEIKGVSRLLESRAK